MFAGELSDENRGEHGEKLLTAKDAKKGAKDARKRDPQHKGGKTELRVARRLPFRWWEERSKRLSLGRPG